MEDNHKNIYRDLSQFEDRPPEILFEKILGRIRNESTVEAESKLEGLKDLAIPPPPQLYANIIDSVSRKKTAYNSTIHFLSKYRAVAAIFLIGLIIVAVVSQMKTEKNNEGTVKANSTPTTKNFDTIAVLQNNKELVSKNKAINNPNKATTVSSNQRQLTLNMPFVDNDLLYSLTECPNCDFAAYFTKKKKFVLDIDQYSSVTVTDKMSAFMKILYSTNRRKKPTHKARKAKKTLLSWKKTDATYFDSSFNKSALDPLDLTEYILNEN